MKLKIIWAWACLIGFIAGIAMMIAFKDDPVYTPFILLALLPFTASVLLAIKTYVAVTYLLLPACLLGSILVGVKAVDTKQDRGAMIAVSTFLLLIGVAAIASAPIFDCLSFLCWFYIWGCSLILAYGGTYRVIEFLEEGKLKFRKPRILF